MALKKSREDRLKECKAVHGETYDYTNSIFNGYLEKFTYVCPKHGKRTQTLERHLKTIGCAVCAREKAARKKQEKAAETFFQRMTILHNGKYNYKDSIYDGVKNKFTYVCPKHGKRTQVAGDHMRGSGCGACGDEDQATRAFLKAQKKFFETIKKIHNYDYSESIYWGGLSPFTFYCPTHGYKTVLAQNHAVGSGCPDCAISGFKPDKPAILYYLKHIESGYYKSGITNRTVKERFESRYKEFKIIQITEFEKGQDAKLHETKILEENANYRITFDDFAGNGGTEFFNKDILKLDVKEDKG